MSTPMNAASISRVIESKNYYYAQGLGGHGIGASFKTVILAANKREAETLGKQWQEAKGFRDLHLYRNNYKPECRAMLAAGNYYGELK